MVSKTLFLATTLAALVLCVLLVVPPADSKCCKSSGDFQCCGEGPCNLFCCNCKRDCAQSCTFDPTIALAIAQGAVSIGGTILGKRDVSSRLVSHSQPISDYDATVNAFDRIDLNRDRVIDFIEALAYLKNVSEKRPLRQRSAFGREDANEFALQFESVDVNQNGVIEPHEFDYTLA